MLAPEDKPTGANPIMNYTKITQLIMYKTVPETSSMLSAASLAVPAGCEVCEAPPAATALHLIDCQAARQRQGLLKGEVLTKIENAISLKNRLPEPPEAWQPPVSATKLIRLHFWSERR